MESRSCRPTQKDREISPNRGVRLWEAEGDSGWCIQFLRASLPSSAPYVYLIRYVSQIDRSGEYDPTGRPVSESSSRTLEFARFAWCRVVLPGGRRLDSVFKIEGEDEFRRDPGVAVRSCSQALSLDA